MDLSRDKSLHSSHLISKDNVDLKNLYRDPVEKYFNKKNQKLDRESKILKENLQLLNSSLNETMNTNKHSKSSLTAKDIMHQIQETVNTFKPKANHKAKNEAIQRIRQRPALQLNSNNNHSKSLVNLKSSPEVKILNLSVAKNPEEYRNIKSPILNSVKKVIGEKSITK
jgi:hypothetical protein